MSSGTERPGTPMASADDQRVLAAYRTASAALDEAPSADTRAAILAAAARAAGSRPRPVGRPGRWRLPLAAAASVLAGTIALLIATQVEQPTGSDARDAAAEAVSASPPRAAPTVAAPASQAQVAAQPPPAVDPPATPPPSPGAPAAAKSGPSIAAGGGRRASPPEAASPAPPQPPPPVEAFPDAAAPPSGAAAATAPEPSRGPAAGDSPAGAGQSKPAPPLPSQDTSGSAPAPAAGAPAAARSATEPRRDSAAEAATPWQASAESWIERIVKLRAEDRHAEADAELAALKARHPDVRPPAAALPPKQR